MRHVPLFVICKEIINLMGWVGLFISVLPCRSASHESAISNKLSHSKFVSYPCYSLSSLAKPTVLL